MTDFDPAIVTEGEHGLVRVFHYIPDPDNPHTGNIFGFIGAMDVGTVAANHIQRVVIKDLNGMPLSDFLGRAYSIEQDKLDPHVDILDGLGGVAFVVRSSAFPNKPVTINTQGDAKLIATLPEPGVDISFETLPDEGAKRTALDAPPPKKTPSDAAMSGRIATVALLVMGLLVWLMIWVAG